MVVKRKYAPLRTGSSILPQLHQRSSMFTFTLTKEQLAEIEDEKKVKADKRKKRAKQSK